VENQNTGKEEEIKEQENKYKNKMAIKEFKYRLEGEESPRFDKLETDGHLRYLHTRHWTGEVTTRNARGGNIDAYFMTPGFYVELISNSISPIMAIGEESDEEEFRINLASKLRMNVTPA